MIYKVKRSVLKNILLLFPFFLPHSIDMMVNDGSSLALVVDRICAVVRWLLTGYMFVNYIKKPKQINLLTIALLLFAATRILSMYMNHELAINYLVGLASYFGFILLIDKMWEGNVYTFILGIIGLLGVMSFLGAFFNILMPYGFNHAMQEDFAIYFLGSKNSGFYYFFPFVYFYSVYYYLKNGKIPLKSSLFCAVFIFAAFCTNSANTIICLSIFLLILVRWDFFKKKNIVFNPKLLLFFIVPIEILVLYGVKDGLVSDFVGIWGKTASFSGRDVIWAYYIAQFAQNVLWGAGPQTKFEETSWFGGAAHAHNFFLDNLAKYGMIEFFALMIMFVVTIRYISLYKDKGLMVMSSVAFFLISLHSLFDDITLFLLLLFMATMMKLVNVDTNVILKK